MLPSRWTQLLSLIHHHHKGNEALVEIVPLVDKEHRMVFCIPVPHRQLIPNETFDADNNQACRRKVSAVFSIHFEV